MNQPRLLQRAIRQNAVVRRYIKCEQLQLLVKKYFPVDCPTYANIITLIEKIPKSSLSSVATPSSLIVPLPTLIDDVIQPVVETKNDDKIATESTDQQQQQQQQQVKSATLPSDKGDLEAILPTNINFIPVTYILPEVEIYVSTLIITTLLRYNCNIDAAHASTLLIERLKAFNRRSLDIFTSKVYFYLSLSYERIQHHEHIRPTLFIIELNCITSPVRTA